MSKSPNQQPPLRNQRPDRLPGRVLADARMLLDSSTLTLQHSPNLPPPLPSESQSTSVPALGPVEQGICLEPRSAALLGPFPLPWRHPLRCLAWLVRAAFGMASLVLLLAVVAAIPILNFVALGYMLEAEGNVARTGKLRAGNPLFRLAPRVGSIALGIFLWLIPLQILASRVADAAIIDPTGAAAARLSNWKLFAAIVVAIHLCMALARGGTLGCFFRPIKNFRWLWRRFKDGDYWDHAHYHVMDFVSELRVRHHFFLGLKGAFGAFVWLLIPTALYAFYDVQNRDNPLAAIITVVGGLLLVLVFAWLPFLQARFAAENRLRAMFELRAVRMAFRRSPLTWLVAVIMVYVLALPLYLTKARLLPQDAIWLITAVFIVSMYPARIITGWVYHRAMCSQRVAWFGWRWGSRLAMLPLLGIYVFLVFFSQAIGEHGKAGLFEHHAFLLPVPF